MDMGFPSWIRIDFFTLHPHSTMLGCSKWSTENIWESGTYEWMFYPLLQGFGNPLICGDIMASHDTQVILLISCWCKNPPKNCHKKRPLKVGKIKLYVLSSQPFPIFRGLSKKCMWPVCEGSFSGRFGSFFSDVRFSVPALVQRGPQVMGPTPTAKTPNCSYASRVEGSSPSVA